MKRKGERKLPRDYLYEPYGAAHPLARTIVTGTHWFEAWCFQHTLSYHRLKKATGISSDRAMQIVRGAQIKRAELDALAKACGVQSADIIASMPGPHMLEDADAERTGAAGGGHVEGRTTSDKPPEGDDCDST